MAKTDYKSIDDYHQAFPKETVARMQCIRDIIRAVVPDAEETISYQIPCFKHHGYLLYYAGFAQHISLSYPFSPVFLEHFSKDLQDFKVSKSAIQLPNEKPLPEKLIQAMVVFRKQENETKAKKKK